MIRLLDTVFIDYQILFHLIVVELKFVFDFHRSLLALLGQPARHRRLLGLGVRFGGLNVAARSDRIRDAGGIYAILIINCSLLRIMLSRGGGGLDGW